MNLLDLVPFKGHRTTILAVVTLLYFISALVLQKVDMEVAIAGISGALNALFAAQHVVK